MGKQIYFQSSLPRAGSTLLQNIMGQNPEFYVTPTSGVLELLYSARGQYSTSLEFKAQDAKLMRDGWLSFCKAGLNGFFEGITDKPYVMDKSRGWGIHYDFLASFVEDPKIICMVRDIRSIYSSMEKNFRKSPELSKGMINWSKAENTTIAKRVDTWSQTIPVGLGISRLKEIIDRGIDKHILFIRYEDLTSNPKEELMKIYNFLGLPYYEHDFKNVEQITHEDDSVYGVYGDHIIKKEIKYINPDYNKILGPELSQNIANSYKWFYDYFNYEI